MNSALTQVRATDGRLDFGSDIAVRNAWFSRESYSHPAKLHLGLLQWIIDRYTRPGETICDPMAGVGSILLAATQQRSVIAREIEPRWLALLHTNAAAIYEQAGLLAGRIEIAQADAREPWNIKADHVVFSPPYACRASANKQTRVGILDHRMRAITPDRREAWKHIFRDDSGSQGAFLFHYGEHPSQIGHLRDHAYWLAMQAIYTHARDTLNGGYMVLIIKDHIKDGQCVHVADMTVELCEARGLALYERHQRRVYPLSLWQRRRKERGEPVIEHEDVLVFVRREAQS